MKVAVCIASHQRQQPLSIVLRCLPADWHATVVVSDAADYEAVVDLERPNTYVHLFPNNPVGAKWQHAVDCARKGNPDLLVITGSDDVLLGNTAQLAATMEGYDSMGLRQWLAYDGRQHYTMRYAEHVMIPVGCGRVYTRALLERMRWQVFDTERSRGLDNLGYYNTLRAGGSCPIVDEIPGLQCISLKGPWDMYNPLPKLMRSHNMLITPAPHILPLANYQFDACVA